MRWTLEQLVDLAMADRAMADRDETFRDEVVAFLEPHRADLETTANLDGPSAWAQGILAAADEQLGIGLHAKLIELAGG